MSHKTKAELERQISTLLANMDGARKEHADLHRRLAAEERRREELERHFDGLRADCVALSDLVRHMGETIRTLAEQRYTATFTPEGWSVVASRTYEEQP